MSDDHKANGLTRWLLEEHPLFRTAGRRLLDVLSIGGPQTIDELVVRSRYQVRTVLLCLGWLDEQRRILPDDQGRVSLPGSTTKPAPRSFARHDEVVAGAIGSQYLSILGKREQPVLLWGQRRLIPSSAIERAEYLSRWVAIPNGKAIFLGDDDLVSPLFAASFPSWEVTVVDIDREVLGRATQIATVLGAQLRTRHEDISQIVSGLAGEFDLAIADPFPSGDGSFEQMFWTLGRTLLRYDGHLISTVAPSHKPVGYSVGALAALRSLGFSLVDLQADFGQYEVFDFEFTDREVSILSRLALTPNVAHTKSLFSATVGQYDTGAACEPVFSFSGWTAATLQHYLTLQAGIDSQRALASSRGLTGVVTEMPGEACSGIDVAAAFPRVLGDLIRRSTDSASLRRVLEINLNASLGISSTAAEIDELTDLAMGGRPGPANSEMALAFRAIESWERWRLDD